MFLPTLRTLVQTLSGRAPKARRPRRPGGVGFSPGGGGWGVRRAPAPAPGPTPAGGLWNVGSNWSTGAVPGAADDVTIGRLNPGAAVTHGSGTDAVHSLSLASAL